MTISREAAALITGGGTGIGRATALELARRGCRKIAITYTTSIDDANRTCEALSALDVEAIALKMDIRSEVEVKDLVDTIIKRFGQLDILVNNAGITRYVPLADLDGLTDDIWNLVFDTNLRGAFYCCRAAATHLRKTKGAIVNVASMAGLRGAGSSIAYSVSKAGVIHLTKVLAVALSPEIRVNSVSPGFVQTRWMERGVGKEASLAEADRVGGETPLARVAMPEDVGEAIANLIESSFVTGQDIVIDGGKSLKYD
ncbi:MAG TPA: SDR family oxidoreductase [Rhizobium sp.]